MTVSLMKYELTPSGCLGVNMFIPLDASHERQQTRGEWVANGWRMGGEWVANHCKANGWVGSRWREHPEASSCRFRQSDDSASSQQHALSLASSSIERRDCSGQVVYKIHAITSIYL
jgi:hypothetical protein